MKKIYGKPHCPRCQLLVNKLDRNGEEFEYYNIKDMTTEAVQKLVNKAGTFELPIVIEE